MSSEWLPSGDSPVFNEAEGLARMGYDRELFRELMQMILDVLPESLQELDAALGQKDQARLHRVAHNLKGHLSTVGSGSVVEAANRLDAEARSGDLEKARMTHAVVLREVERLRLAMQNWLRDN